MVSHLRGVIVDALPVHRLERGRDLEVPTLPTRNRQPLNERLSYQLVREPVNRIAAPTDRVDELCGFGLFQHIEEGLFIHVTHPFQNREREAGTDYGRAAPWK